VAKEGKGYLKLYNNDRYLAPHLPGVSGWVWLEVVARGDRTVSPRQIALSLGLAHDTVVGILGALELSGLVKVRVSVLGDVDYTANRDPEVHARLLRRTGFPVESGLTPSEYWNQYVPITDEIRHKLAQLPGGVGWVWISMFAARHIYGDTFKTTEALRQDVGFHTLERVQRSLRVLREHGLVAPKRPKGARCIQPREARRGKPNMEDYVVELG
jgi:hypothetical protein